MKIIVTGALGHIGSKLIRDLSFHFKGVQIVLVDNLATQRYCSLFNLPSEGNFKFIQGDILKINFDEVLETGDVVIHLAALTDAETSFGRAKEVEETNFHGTEKVGLACLKNNCKLIYLSTTSVYGSQSSLVDETCPIAELKPQSPYADAKLKGENFLRGLPYHDYFKFVIFRFGTICGVSPGMRFHTAINKFSWQAVYKQPITVWKTALNQLRPYLTLDDGIGSIIHIIKKDMFHNDLFNVVSKNCSVGDIIEIIKKFQKDVCISFVDSAIMNQLSYEVSSDKIKKTGLILNGSLSKCIEETIFQLHKSNC